MAWSGKVDLRVTATESSDLAGSSEVGRRIAYAIAQAFSTGTAALNINEGYQADISTDTTGVTLDLNALADAATNTGAAPFGNVKLFIVVNTHATATMIVGNAASAQFTPGFSAATNTVTLQPGGWMAFSNPAANGWDSTTAKNLKIVAGSGTVTGVLILLGEN